MVEIQKLKLKLEKLVESIEKSFTEFGAILGEETKGKAENAIKRARKELLQDSGSTLNEIFYELNDLSQVITKAIMEDPLAQMGIGGASGTKQSAPEEKKK